jgi:hypothetical protein
MFIANHDNKVCLRGLFIVEQIFLTRNVNAGFVKSLLAMLDKYFCR